MTTIKRLLLTISAALCLSACATVPSQKAEIIPGKGVETIQSSVHVAVKTAERSISARGYLIFKQPDKFHLVILSPFGNPFLDVYAYGERVSCIIPSQGVAFAGTVAELPEQEGLQNLGLMKWLVATPQLAGETTGTMQHLLADGRTETVVYNGDGKIQRKSMDSGDEVLFSDYRIVSGVSFPHGAEIHNRRNDILKISFDEPEINGVVDEALLTPRFDGLAILPFSRFTGF